MQFPSHIDPYKQDPFSLLHSIPVEKYYISRFNEKVKVKKDKKGKKIEYPNFKIIEHYLIHHLKGADVVMLWLDKDQSGEATCVQVIDLINHYNKI